MSSWALYEWSIFIGVLVFFSWLIAVCISLGRQAIHTKYLQPDHSGAVLHEQNSVPHAPGSTGLSEHKPPPTIYLIPGENDKGDRSGDQEYFWQEDPGRYWGPVQYIRADIIGSADDVIEVGNVIIFELESHLNKEQAAHLKNMLSKVFIDKVPVLLGPGVRISRDHQLSQISKQIRDLSDITLSTAQSLATILQALADESEDGEIETDFQGNQSRKRDSTQTL